MVVLFRPSNASGTGKRCKCGPDEAQRSGSPRHIPAGNRYPTQNGSVIPRRTIDPQGTQEAIPSAAMINCLGDPIRIREPF
jgi:hypothetical protein